MAKNEGDSFLNAKISYPVPCEHAFYCYNDIFPERLDDSEKNISISIDVSVQPDLPFCIKDAEIHFPCVKIDSAIILVLFGVKSHGLPPLFCVNGL